MKVGEPGLEEQISEYRKKIDSLDNHIAEQLNKRAEFSLAIRELKQEAKLPILDPQREQEILTRLSVSNRGPLKDKDLQGIYRNLLHHMKNFE
ncbi:MAG: chorismate mutase [Actinomycetia bacterium]|nr:chorismate mutase [Actinomycetes bacterium]